MAYRLHCERRTSAYSFWSRRKSSVLALPPSYFWFPIASGEGDALKGGTSTEPTASLPRATHDIGAPVWKVEDCEDLFSSQLWRELTHDQPEISSPSRTSSPDLQSSREQSTERGDQYCLPQADIKPLMSAHVEEFTTAQPSSDCFDAHAPPLPTRKRQRSEENVNVDTEPSKPRERWEIPKVARQGQAHWLTSRDELRRQWDQREFGEWEGQFREQLKMCSRGHIRSQHECLLRSLHMAAVDGLIRPAAFDGDDEWERSFLGWTSFQVVREHAGEFRRRIAELFERPPTDSTLNNCLRRAGFGPSALCWDQAWSGLTAFEYDSKRRARYGKGTDV